MLNIFMNNPPPQFYQINLQNSSYWHDFKTMENSVGTDLHFFSTIVLEYSKGYAGSSQNKPKCYLFNDVIP